MASRGFFMACGKFQKWPFFAADRSIYGAWPIQRCRGEFSSLTSMQAPPSLVECAALTLPPC